MLERQTTGSLVSAKDCHPVSDYQLMQKCHFLSQIVILLCVTEIRHKSGFPTGTHENDLVLVRGDGAIGWTILLFILRRKQWQHCWEVGNKMEYTLTISNIWYTILKDTNGDYVCLLSVAQLKRCYFHTGWREVGEYWIQVHTHHSLQILHSHPEDTISLE